MNKKLKEYKFGPRDDNLGMKNFEIAGKSASPKHAAAPTKLPAIGAPLSYHGFGEGETIAAEPEQYIMTTEADKEIQTL